MRLTNLKNDSGYSLTELMIAVGLAAVVFGAGVKLTSFLSSAKEQVSRNIDLDGARWYVRDSLDCNQTLGISDSTTLPLVCGDYSADKKLTMRTRSRDGSSAGLDLNTVFSNTAWKFRTYCRDSGLVVEYAPKKPRAVDRAAPAQVSPSETIPPRIVVPDGLETSGNVPAVLGFSYVGTTFKDEKPIPCPPTSSLGGLIALVRFAAQTVLNVARVDDGAKQLEAQWGPEVAKATAAVNAGIGSLASELATGPGGEALKTSVENVGNYAKKFVGDLALNALKQGGQAVAANVAGSVLAGKNVDSSTLLTGFTAGALDSVAKQMGAPPLGSNLMNALQSGRVGLFEMMNEANTIDSGLNLYAKLPLQVGIAMTDVQKSLDQRMDAATEILWRGASQGLSKNKLLEMAAKAAIDTNRFVREEVAGQLTHVLNDELGTPLKKFANGQIDGLKKVVGEKLDGVREDAKTHGRDSGVLKSISDHKDGITKGIDSLKGVFSDYVTNEIRKQANGMTEQLASKINDPHMGVRAVLEKFVKEADEQKMDPRATVPDSTNRIRFRLPPIPDIPALPKPKPAVAANDGWRDLFSGQGLFCRDAFRWEPLRDFADDSNPCPFVSSGDYPFLAGRNEGVATCCREVPSAPQGVAQCAGNEFVISGGAECSTGGKYLGGAAFVRPDVRPVFSGRGFGIALGFKVGPGFGGGIGHIPPKPHKHVVQGGAKVLLPPVGPGAIAVNEVFYDNKFFLGGFLRASSVGGGAGGGMSATSASCMTANQRGSRDNVWTQSPYPATSRSLCCPILGIRDAKSIRRPN
jgi:hypothetical protein